MSGKIYLIAPRIPPGLCLCRPKAQRLKGPSAQRLKGSGAQGLRGSRARGPKGPETRPKGPQIEPKIDPKSPWAARNEAQGATDRAQDRPKVAPWGPLGPNGSDEGPGGTPRGPQIAIPSIGVARSSSERCDKHHSAHNLTHKLPFRRSVSQKHVRTSIYPGVPVHSETSPNRIPSASGGP